ncbi:hypothetical protein, partial [Mesorhizobium sp. M7A.F.Ca.CA.001.08.2.1]
AIERLIAEGHSPAEVWRYTPRQIVGFIGFAARRRNHDAAATLALGALAARGDPKDLKKQIADLDRE